MDLLKKILTVLWLVITLGVLVVLIFYIWNTVDKSSQVISETLMSLSPNQKNQLPPQYASSIGNVKVKAYLINVNSACLDTIDVDVEMENSYEATCYNLIFAMQRQANENLISPIPNGLSVRGIYLLGDGELVIDLPALILKQLPIANTAIGELLWVYSLTNTLLQSELYKETKVTGLKILVEGSEPEVTLFEHINIASVFLPDYLLLCNTNL